MPVMKWGPPRSHVDQVMIDKIIVRNSLTPLQLTKTIFGGACPFCGHAKTFVLWSERGQYRCYFCGCDGRFVRSPERELEERKLLKARLEASEEIS